jgi:hypothetical protein
MTNLGDPDPKTFFSRIWKNHSGSGNYKFLIKKILHNFFKKLNPSVRYRTPATRNNTPAFNMDLISGIRIPKLFAGSGKIIPDPEAQGTKNGMK